MKPLLHLTLIEFFIINNIITCQDSYVIYLITDLVCNKSYVGRTENNLTMRWACHKSHIKTCYCSCRVAAHYNESATLHQWKGNNLDKSLSAELSITLIDKVIPEIWDNADTLFNKLCKKEIYWQNQLRTMQEYGGLNDRDERKLTQKRYSNK